MKKQLLAASAIAGLMLGAAIAQGADSKGAGIVGSVHDMNTVGSIYSVGDPGKRICAFCHSPHHSTQDNNQLSADVANLGVLGVTAKYKIYAPLWSRTGMDTMAAPTPYLSQTFNPQTDAKPYDPLIGPSRLCLTCHDGTIAIDNYYGNTATTGGSTGDAFNGPLGGGDQLSIGMGGGLMGLSNDHPIGMQYNTYQADARYELRADTTPFQTTAGAPSAKMIKSVLYTDPSDTNMNGTKGVVTCASCHDVHNGKDVGNKAPLGNMRGFLLYGSQVNSSFCLTCHDKNPTVPAGN